jgi:phenylacetic acid degradation operon negative regulatory protein
MSDKIRVSIKRHRKTNARFPTVIYTLFGAYILPRGGEVNVADLIELVRPLGFSQNAIRLGLSRMSRRGVFKIRKAGRRSYYSLSRKGRRWMEFGRMRAFHAEHEEWDRKWRLVVYNIPETSRLLRDKLRAELCELGFASLAPSVWVSPRDLRSEIIDFARQKNVTEYVEIFEAVYRGFRSPSAFAAMIWDIDALEDRYRAFVQRYEALRRRYVRSASTSRPMSPAECFAERFCLTAEYVGIRLEDPMGYHCCHRYVGLQPPGQYRRHRPLFRPGCR